MAVRLLIADDHPLVRAGVRELVSYHDIQVVGEAQQGEQVLTVLDETPCDVVLLDVRLHPEDGFEVLAQVKQRHPRLPVVMYSGYDNSNFVNRAVQLGAAGFLRKCASAEQYAEVLKTAAAQGAAFTRDELRKLSNAHPNRQLDHECDAPLTNRELQVLKQMADVSTPDSSTNKMIAEKLNISPETVKEHVQHILRKIGVADRTQAVVWGLWNKVI